MLLNFERYLEQFLALLSYAGVTELDDFGVVSSLKGFPSSSDGKASACNARDVGSIFPGSGRSPGERNGNALQYTCLENFMDRTWWATVHGVAKSHG